MVLEMKEMPKVYKQQFENYFKIDSGKNHKYIS